MKSFGIRHKQRPVNGQCWVMRPTDETLGTIVTRIYNPTSASRARIARFMVANKSAVERYHGYSIIIVYDN